MCFHLKVRDDLSYSPPSLDDQLRAVYFYSPAACGIVPVERFTIEFDTLCGSYGVQPEHSRSSRLPLEMQGIYGWG